MRRLLRLAIFLPLTSACAVPATDDSDTTSSAAMSDIASMQEDGAGTYTVTCRGGRIELAVTVERLKADRVCSPSSFDSTMFDPASCPGAALTPDGVVALAQFDVVAGKTSARFGTTSHAIRVRDCNTTGACGSWRSAPAQPGLVVKGYEYYTTGGACPFAQRAPVLCGPGETHTRERFLAMPLAPSALGALLDAEVRLELAYNKPTVHLLGSVATSRGTYAWSPSASFDGELVLFNDSEPTYRWATMAASYADASYAPREGLGLRGKVTSTCARWGTSQRLGLSDGAGNSYVRESELVVFAQH